MTADTKSPLWQIIIMIFFSWVLFNTQVRGNMGHTRIQTYTHTLAHIHTGTHTAHTHTCIHVYTIYHLSYDTRHDTRAAHFRSVRLVLMLPMPCHWCQPSKVHSLFDGWMVPCFRFLWGRFVGTVLRRLHTHLSATGYGCYMDVYGRHRPTDSVRAVHWQRYYYINSDILRDF